MIGRGIECTEPGDYNEPRMPWPQVVALLAQYAQLEKQGDTGLYHVARIKQRNIFEPVKRLLPLQQKFLAS